MAVAGAHGQAPETFVGEQLLEDLDGDRRPARLRLELGQQQVRAEPIGVGPADPRRGLEAVAGFVKLAFTPGRGRQPGQQPKLVAARRLGQGHAVERSQRPARAGLPARKTRVPVDPGPPPRRLGQADSRSPPVRHPGDLFAITFDQPAVLAEDDQCVVLRDHQVAVAGDQVASGRAVNLHELDRRLGAQARSLIENLNLIAGRPVDPIAGKQAAPVSFRSLARVWPGGNHLVRS